MTHTNTHTHLSLRRDKNKSGKALASGKTRRKGNACKPSGSGGVSRCKNIRASLPLMHRLLLLERSHTSLKKKE